MRHLRLIVFGLAIVVLFQRADGAQEIAPAAAPTLAYTLMEWPTQATSAAGFPAAWNLIQAAGVAVSPMCSASK